ncbi:MAG: signal peptidase I [bacterium]|nr:signal peptidase I [bacterium]
MEDKTNKSTARIIQEIIQVILVALVLAILIRIFFLEAFLVPSTSMESTLQPGDQVLVWKFLYNRKIPVLNKKTALGFPVRRKDIIVIRMNEDENLIKRVIGLAGDRVILKEGQVHVNGRLLKEPYLRIDPSFQYLPTRFDVPGRHYFVMGDFRANSKDSRDFGFIPENKITGRAILIYYPFSRIKVLHHE